MVPPGPSERDVIEKVPLRLGNEFQAIRLLARSQSSPLKSIAELVENSIDAKARHCVVERDLSGGGFLRVSDDGKGIMTADGRPDFKAVLQRIGDSAKAKLAPEERESVKGEFGLGLLGFYALGARLTMVSKSRLPNGSTTKTYKMMIVRDLADADRWTAPESVERIGPGVDVTIEGLTLPIRKFPAQKIRDYLSTELRGRLAGIQLTFRDGDSPPVDIKPRVYRGTKFSRSRIDTKYGLLLIDLYLCPPEGEQDVKVSVGVKGTKVYDRIDSIPGFGMPPWISGKVQGFIDYPAARPTPNRAEFVPNKFYDELVRQLEKLTPMVLKEIRDVEKDIAEKEDRALIEEIRRVFRRAFEDLPRGHYDFFDTRGAHGPSSSAKPGQSFEVREKKEGQDTEEAPSVLALDSLEIHPNSTQILRGAKKNLKAVASDANKREVTHDLTFEWEMRGGIGLLEDFGPSARFTAGSRLGAGRVIVRAAQGDITRTAEATIDVVEKITKRRRRPRRQPGIPNLEKTPSPMEEWHSRYVRNRNVIEYNSKHTDYLQVMADPRAKRVYVMTLVSKEVVQFNVDQGFFPPDQALERMVEVVSTALRALRAPR